MTYIVGEELKQKLSLELKYINDKEICNIINGEIIIILNEGASSNIPAWYKYLNKAIKNGNRIIALDNNADKNLVNAIFMFLISNRIYDNYNVESLEIIDDEYISNILTRKATVEEIENYLDDNLEDYNEVCVVLHELNEAVNRGDIKLITEIVQSNGDKIENAIKVLEYFKIMQDKLVEFKDSIQLDDSLNEINEIKEEIIKKDILIQELEDEKSANNEDNKLLRAEIIKKSKQMDELLAQVNGQGVHSYTYKTISTGAINTEIKNIIYFKEISYVRYINSLVIHLQSLLTYNSSFKVKLLIYDRKNDFSSIYQPLQLVGMNDFLRSKEQCLKDDKLVIIEPNRNILEEILKNKSNDVLIIYDRLKCKDNLVSGINVHNFWVLNSKHEFNELKDAYKMDIKRCIVPNSAVPNSPLDPELLDTIAIAQLKEYKQATPSSKSSKYFLMPNLHSRSKDDKVMKTLCDLCKISINK